MFPPFLSRAALAGATATLALGIGVAEAGECPREHVLSTPRAIENAPDVGVARETLSVVNITGYRGVGNLRLRTRLLTIAVGGIVPFHTHEDRPSIVYILSGEIIEHSRTCAVPIVHRAGEHAAEYGAQEAHWWENRTGQPVVILSSDVLPPEMLDFPEM